MRKTEWKRFVQGGTKYKIRAEYGLQKIGNQDPYFSVTGEIKRQAGNGRWMEDCGGCIHDEVGKHFPKLKPLIKWHLCSVKEPMHYLANSKYWFGIGEYSERNLDHFKSTCIYGALSTDSEFDFENEEWPIVKEWLIIRLPALIDTFNKELVENDITN